MEQEIHSNVLRIAFHFFLEEVLRFSSSEDIHIYSQVQLNEGLLEEKILIFHLTT
jgi:hypothetical protein